MVSGFLLALLCKVARMGFATISVSLELSTFSLCKWKYMAKRGSSTVTIISSKCKKKRLQQSQCFISNSHVFATKTNVIWSAQDVAIAHVSCFVLSTTKFGGEFGDESSWAALTGLWRLQRMKHCVVEINMIDLYETDESDWQSVCYSKCSSYYSVFFVIHKQTSSSNI